MRETPVSSLRKYLQEQGAEVAWNDSLVSVWEGTKSVDLSWECDVAIIATKQFGMDFNQLITRGIPVLDCTNSIKNLPGVTCL